MRGICFILPLAAVLFAPAAPVQGANCDELTVSAEASGKDAGRKVVFGCKSGSLNGVRSDLEAGIVKLDGNKDFRFFPLVDDDHALVVMGKGEPKRFRIAATGEALLLSEGEPPRDGLYVLENKILSLGAKPEDRAPLWAIVAIAILGTALLWSLVMLGRSEWAGARMARAVKRGEEDARQQERDDRKEEMETVVRGMLLALDTAVGEPLKAFCEAVLQQMAEDRRSPEPEPAMPEPVRQPTWEDHWKAILDAGYRAALEGVQREEFLARCEPVALEPNYSDRLTERLDTRQAMLWGFPTQDGRWLVALGPQGERDLTKANPPRSYEFIFDIAPQAYIVVTPALIDGASLTLVAKGALQ